MTSATKRDSLAVNANCINVVVNNNNFAKQTIVFLETLCKTQQDSERKLPEVWLAQE